MERPTSKRITRNGLIITEYGTAAQQRLETYLKKYSNARPGSIVSYIQEVDTSDDSYYRNRIDVFGFRNAYLLKKHCQRFNLYWYSVTYGADLHRFIIDTWKQPNPLVYKIIGG